MTTFPGESIGIGDAADGTDHTLAGAIIKRGAYFSGPGSATLAAGDTWRAWVYPGAETYLTAADTAVVSWVVEVPSGTVTVTAGEAFDPDYGDDTLAPSSSLGTHTVTGPATLVIPSGFTVADIVDGADALMLHLAATAGSADVQQVKLRVWPPDGPLGGWSDPYPSWETAPTAPTVRYGLELIEGTATTGDAASAFDGAVSAFHAAAPDVLASQVRALASTQTVGAIRQAVEKHESPTEYVGDMTATVGLILIVGSDWSGVYPLDPSLGLSNGTDYIRPPEEVADDTGVWFQQVGEGSTGWTGDVAVYSTAPDPDEFPGVATYYSEAGDWPLVGTGYNVEAPITIGAPGYGRFALDTNGKRILVSIAHEAVLGSVADEFPGWEPTILGAAGRGEDMPAGLGDFQTYAILPPYRVWSPTATARGIVRHYPRDDGVRGSSPKRYGGHRGSYQAGRQFGYQ